MENPMHSLKAEFQAESIEHLDLFEKEVILLEKDPDPETITRIFRAIHSIKGAAGFMAYTNITEVSHQMETLLQMMRQKTVHPERRVIDVLLAGNDLLKQMMQNLDASNQMDIREVVERIATLIASFSTENTRKQLDATVVIMDAHGDATQFYLSEFNIDGIPTDYPNMCIIKCNLHDLQNQKNISPFALIRVLLKSGLILSTRLESEAFDFDMDLSEAPLIYEILYATVLPPENIRDMVGLNDLQILSVQKPVIQQLKPETKKSQTQTTQQAAKENICPETEALHPGKEEHHDMPDTIRLRVDVLDQLMKLAGELVLVRNNLLVMTRSDQTYQGISQRLNLVTSELQETIMQTRLQPIGNLFAKLPRLVRDLSLKLSKQIEINTRGNEVELDKTILEALTDPLMHLIRNCCDHGIERSLERKQVGKPAVGQIIVRAWHEAGQINIEIRDDGRGIDPDIIKACALKAGFKTVEELSHMTDKELLSLILMPGFSTAESVSDISGRGVGMDVVQAGVERLGGTIELSSKKSSGTHVHLRLPLTLAIIPCLLIEVEGIRYAVPQVNLVELVCLRNEDIYTRIESAGDQEVYRLRDRLLPMVRLREVLKRRTAYKRSTRAGICGIYVQESEKALSEGRANQRDMLNFAVVKIGTRRYGLVVDQVIGVEEVVVNPVHSALKSLQIYSGTTIMGDGTVALILDIEGIARHADVQFNLKEESLQEVLSDDETQTVLLFKSGPQEHFAVPLPMIRRVEHIHTSRIEWIGNKEFITVDGIPNRVLRLESCLNVSPCLQKENMLLLLPKHIRRPFGILVSDVLDTVQTPLDLNTESHMEEGLLGSVVIQDHMTLLLDIYKLIERAEPDWFAERKKKAPPPKERKQILLLEDTPFFRNLVKGYLETDGYVVTAVENGREGVAALKEKSFDIIVSDLDMPVMNGWAFLEHIREDTTFSDLPAIALTALDSEADRIRAEKAGFNGYQIKLDREDLLTYVSRFLRPTNDAGKEAL